MANVREKEAASLLLFRCQPLRNPSIHSVSSFFVSQLYYPFPFIFWVFTYFFARRFINVCVCLSPNCLFICLLFAYLYLLMYLCIPVDFFGHSRIQRYVISVTLCYLLLSLYLHGCISSWLAAIDCMSVCLLLACQLISRSCSVSLSLSHTHIGQLLTVATQHRQTRCRAASPTPARKRLLFQGSQVLARLRELSLLHACRKGSAKAASLGTNS